MPSLKRDSVFVLRVRDDGTLRDEAARESLNTINRYRDLAVSRDGRTTYVVADDFGFTSGPTKDSTQQLTHRGVAGVQADRLSSGAARGARAATDGSAA